MALQRRLLLGVLTVSSLLFVYILCVNLEATLSWPLTPLKHFYGFPPGPNSGSGDSEETSSFTFHTEPSSAAALNPNTSTVETQTAAPHRPAENQVLDPQPGSRPDGHDRPRISTRRPTSRPTSRPTEPAFIGDVYISEDIPPQTVCANGVRSRVRNTEFGGRFLEHVPVLQWVKHLNPEQYQRLSQYVGAHGWGGVDYKTLEDTLSVLNSSANRQMLDDWKLRGNGSQCIRCAVVGNGGILRDSKKGDEIDRHHYVFRTNGAIIKGFEQDVGSRTTHYTFSTNTLRNSLRSYGGVGYRGPPVSNETRYIFLPDHDRDYLMMKGAATHTRVERGPERNEDPTKYFGKDVSSEKLKMYHPDFVRYLRNRFLRSNALKTRYKDIYRPSTGAVMLLAALHTCDQVSAYGFMTPDYRNFSDHYYDNTYHPVGFFINHDLRLEMTLWQQLNQAGLIRLYMHK